MFKKPNGRFLHLCLTSIIFLLILASNITTANAAERMLVVLDGSGSMWGQINGKPKLEIAIETLSEVLKAVAADTEIGLMAYGHREKGNCADIELIVPAAAGTKNQIINAVNNLKFLGKTPLSAAVKLAAKELAYTENKATVILITDGIETCDANVCETGNLLESQGINFTTHVVGFGLSNEEGRQVACLAENTGGQYFAAANADELVAALAKTIATPLPSVELIAIDQDGEPLENYPLDWQILDATDAVIQESKARDSLNLSLVAGNYKVKVEGEDAIGGGEFKVTSEPKQQFNIPLEVQKLEATLTAPESVSVGAEFTVEWTGPNHKSDYISINELGAGPGRYITYEYTSNGSPVKITAPDKVGSFEIRYVLSRSKQILASQEIKTTPVEASLEAIPTVAAGAELEVSWTGPNNKGDFITISELGSEEGTYLKYRYTQNANPVTLTAPDGLGVYEIRYVSGQSKRTLASREVTLGEVAAKLEAPDEVAAGANLEVNWTGPDNKGDFITISKLSSREGKYLKYRYTQTGNPAKLVVPDALGIYEIRYVFGRSKRTLAAREINILPISATLTAQGTAVPGGKLVVEWTGPGYKRDYITVVEKGSPEGKYTDYVLTTRGSPVTLNLPESTGTFEVRYVVGQSKRTLASIDIEL